jgi:uncharacterized integral membrane protein (TIGR00698 family)
MPGQRARWRAAAIAACALVPLLWLGHPALALLTGAAIAVSLDRRPLAASEVVGRYFLQAAIVLLGPTLDLDTLWSLSAQYSWSVAVYVVGTLALGLALGRLLQVDAPSSRLVSAGTAICGGTAIATLSPLLHARPHQVGVTLAVVFLLNAVALFTFPPIGRLLELSQLEFGLWAALAIHDTSSVVATAALYGDEAAAVATTIKLGRTLWLIPLVFVVSLVVRPAAPDGHDPPSKVRVPGFILLFVAAAGVGSFAPVPELATAAAGTLSKLLLVAALFMIGTGIDRATVRRLRGRVVWQALGLWMVVAPATLAAVLWLA